jgi:hypothetical protein
MICRSILSGDFGIRSSPLRKNENELTLYPTRVRLTSIITERVSGCQARFANPA